MIGWKEFFDIKVNASNEAIIGSIQNPEKIIKAAVVLFIHTIGFFVATVLVFRKKDILS
jgi:ABC-2 type transport system permease protein